MDYLGLPLILHVIYSSDMYRIRPKINRTFWRFQIKKSSKYQHQIGGAVYFRIFFLYISVYDAVNNNTSWGLYIEHFRHTTRVKWCEFLTKNERITFTHLKNCENSSHTASESMIKRCISSSKQYSGP